MVVLVTSSDFEQLGLEIIGSTGRSRRRNRHRKFAAFFGAKPFYCSILWYELDKHGWFKRAPTAHVSPRHLLMGLHFLKSYNTEERSSATFGCDEKTFRQWSWFILRGIARLESKFVSLRSLLCGNDVVRLSWLFGGKKSHLKALQDHVLCLPCSASSPFLPATDSMGEQISKIQWQQGNCVC
jgi:hypothetical protein